MSDRKLLALYGLKYNPFLPAIPAEDLWTPPGAERFFYRVETLVLDGGFAVISGEPGLGKSKLLQLLAGRLEHIGEVVVGVMERPQSSLSDMYREMGELFRVDLSPANRYGGFKALRARWHRHIKTTLMRPVLLVDESQEMPTACLNELRLLGSAHFDSECLFTCILCGDNQLPERFRDKALVSLGTRARTRLALKEIPRDDLMALLEHLTERAGAPGLMSDGLRETLVDHAGGNPRILCGLGADLLAAAIERDVARLDEALFFEVFASLAGGRRKARSSARR
jgi:type II secretory pathway predicted ATPase ExeA